MTRRHWTITTHQTGKPREVDVYLYDNVGHLRAAATRHSNRIEPGITSYRDAQAVCHGFQRHRIDAQGERQESPAAVILRFHRGSLTPEVVAHEVAHAVQHLYDIDCINEGDLAAGHFSAGNEVFAYLAGDLFVAVWNLFYGASSTRASPTPSPRHTSVPNSTNPRTI